MADTVRALEGERAELATRLEEERRQAAGLREALSEQQAQAARAEAELRAAHETLVAELQGEIADRAIALRQATEGLALSIEDRILFPSGQATLTPQGRRLLTRVGGALARVSGQRILVEGHTDNVPIGPQLREVYASNWELSSARAAEVVRHLAGRGSLDPARLRAVGRADTEPAADNDTDDGRRQNRRIEIVLIPLPGADAVESH
jgi:chemotaxis protein MotB